MSAGWGMALRLARRETRRRPGRTALVALLVGVPVAALVVGLTVARTVTLSPEEARAAQRGQADEVIDVGGAASLDAAVAAVSAAAPAGSRIVAVASYPDAVEDESGHLQQWSVSDEPLDDPLLAGRREIQEGRAPRGPGEVAVPPDVADQAGVEVGDTVDLLRLGPVRVTGIVETPSQGWDQVIAGRPLAPGPVPGEDTVYVDLPDGGALGPLPDELYLWPPFDWAEEADGLREAVSLGYAAAAVGLLLTGTIASAAFAVGARRHLRTLGLLSATGVPPSGLRRVMVLQGAVTGLVAGVGGAALALVGLAAAAPHLDGWMGHAVGSLTIQPLDLVGAVALGTAAATAAALLPARTAAEVPVLAALAGRRPLVRVPAAVPVLGLALAAAGALVLVVYVASLGDVWWGVGLGGAALVLAGGACTTPWLVSRLEPLAARARGGLRVAARGLARNRARSGAVATAIMAPVAVALFALTVAASQHERAGAQLGRDQVIVEGTGWLQPTAVDAMVADVHEAVPGMADAPLDVVADPATGFAITVLGDRRSSSLVVASPGVLDVLGAPAGTAAVVERGAVARLDAGVSADRPLSVDLGEVVTVGDGEWYEGLPALVVSEEWARQRGLGTVRHSVLLRADEPLSGAERDAVRRLDDPGSRDGWVRNQVLGTPPPDHTEAYADIAPDLSRDGGAVGRLSAGLLAFALLVVGISLALNRAETRDEGALLAALGAPPAIQRATTAWQAFLLPLAGAGIGVPLGVGCAVAVLVAPVGNETVGSEIVLPSDVAVPWMAVAAVLVGVPVAAGLLARVAGAVFGRRRPSDLASVLSWD